VTVPLGQPKKATVGSPVNVGDLGVALLRDGGYRSRDRGNRAFPSAAWGGERCTNPDWVTGMGSSLSDRAAAP